MTDLDLLLAANAAYYTAFQRGDVLGMDRLWAGEGVSCIHPGWPAIVGRTAVMRSWSDILGNSERPWIEFRRAEAIVAGDSGRVICVEIVNAVAFAVSNHFQRIDGVWRMVHHQASLIADPVKAPPEEPPSRGLH